MSMPVEYARLRGRKVGEIATTIGGAAALNEFNLDLCRNGDMALEAAAQDTGADLAEFEPAIDDMETAAPPQETTELIGHIIKRYHDTHRRELPELARLARKVEAVHADHPQAPHGLADVLAQLLGEIEVHMKKEELILFPAMRQRPGGGALDGPIAQMRHDHDDHGEHLRWLENKTGNFMPPEGACGTWQALYSGLAKFRRDLLDHVDLENNVLFPRFEQVKEVYAPGGARTVSSSASTDEAAKAEAAKTVSMRNPPTKASHALAQQGNPLASASLVPMLVAGIVLIVIAMIAAAALS